MRVDHDIFHTPYEVELTLEELPPSASYRTRASGRDLGDTMPMWRVQTEGYEDGEGFLVGVVSHAGLDDSPDGEFISGGKNTKGCDSVAIGRQGNYLHWGFAASPTHMTDEAKRVFVNAVHYIARFDGHRAFVRKSKALTRAAVDDMLWGLSEDGHAAWSALIEDGNRQRLERIDELRARKQRGETLTDFEERMLTLPPPDPWTRARTIRYVTPEPLREELGEDWDAYVTYYTENRPYLHPVETDGYVPPLDVDADAKALGIANHDVALLERCVELLEAGDRTEMATRLLERYTDVGPKGPGEWRAWLDANRDRLFFTEVGGYKFMVDQTPTAGDREPESTGKLDGGAIDGIAVADPTGAAPVRMSAAILPGETDGTATVVVKARILDGWHIYAEVPPGQPYVGTELRLELPPGVEAAGGWQPPEPRVSLEDPSVLTYEGDLVFRRAITVAAGAVADGAELRVLVDYQACDIQMCLPPRTEKLTLTLP